MADKRKVSDVAGEGSARKRPAPTIDLTATEVPASDTSAAAEPEMPPAAQADPPTEGTAPSSEPPKPPPMSGPSPESNEVHPPPRRDGLALVAAIAGGIVGAIIIAIAAGAVWYAGYIPTHDEASNALSTQVTNVERQVKALENRPAPASDTKTLDKVVDELSRRTSKIENQLANLPPTDRAAAHRLAATAGSIQSLTAAVTALGHRSDDIAASAKQAQQSAVVAEKAVADLRHNVQNVAKGESKEPPAAQFDVLQKRVSGLEQGLKDVRGQFANVQSSLNDAQAKIARAAAAERTTRLALTAISLRDAVLNGAPFAPELARAKSLTSDQKALAPLDRFAQSGVPSKSQLSVALSKLIPAMRKLASAGTSSGGFLDRLRANASKLVRIMPVDAPSGSDPTDVLARIAAEAARADVDGALADLAKLPSNVRAPAQDWIATAKARQAALAAARQFAAQSARGLGNG